MTSRQSEQHDTQLDIQQDIPQDIQHGTPDGAQRDVVSLVPSWLSLKEAGDELAVSPNRVRQLARERQLATLRLPHGEPAVPAEFLVGGAIVKGLGGTLVVLADHGFDDAEAIEWLFTADDSLPGRPIDALREDRGKEVRRRAQAIV